MPTSPHKPHDDDLEAVDRPVTDFATIADATDPIRFQPATSDDGAIVEDIYCLDCGYNLRGLSGDPIRCPECGHVNDLGAVAIPAELIRSALKQMETAPTTCVAVAVFGLTAIGLALRAGWPNVVPALVILVGVISGWSVARHQMRRAFEAKPGWGRVLADFHLACLLCISLIPLMIALSWATNFGRRGASPLWILGVVLVWIVLGIIGLRIYYAARRRMLVLQRDRAVHIAHETLRQRLRRER